MRWLFILAIVLPLAAQPTKPPKDRGSAEANRAKSTANTESTESQQTPPAQPTPVSTPDPVAAANKRSGATTEDHAQTSNQQTADENRATQRKLTWFTGILAGVGVLQLVVMFLTWLVYRRQTQEMRRQRHEMVKQRTELSGQRAAIESQLETMQAQLTEMGNQTGILSKSVEVAQANAETARMSVEALIDKERARIIVEPGKLTIAPPDDKLPIDEMKYTVYCLGTTPAFIENADARLAATASTDPPERMAMPPISLKPFWTPNAEGTQHSAILFGSHPSLDDVNARKVFVHFWGVITYKDVFGKRRETRFRYRWRVTDTLKNLDGTPFSHWVKCGPDTDNSQT